jgi:hypothetical protein
MLSFSAKSPYDMKFLRSQILIFQRGRVFRHLEYLKWQEFNLTNKQKDSKKRQKFANFSLENPFFTYQNFSKLLAACFLDFFRFFNLN